MRRFRSSIGCALLAAAFATTTGFAVQEAANPPIVGRWDIVVTAGDQSYPSWLEVEPSGYHTLVGRFVGHFGSSRPVGQVHYADGKFWFTVAPQWEQGDKDLKFEGTVNGDALTGTTTDAMGASASFKAVRAPELPAPANPKWGKPIVLFNGKDLTGWRPHDERPNKWEVRDKILTNTAPGTDLVTTSTYQNFKLHVEFRYPANSNSGVYLRGRYEVQITDNDNRDVGRTGLAAIYGFLEPTYNAALKPGDWQTFDITLLGRVVTIALNGRTVTSERIIPGITGGALDGNEGVPGPLYIQGDHGPIEYRSIVITPAV